MSNIGLKPRNQNERDVIELMTRCHDWLAEELGIKSTMEFGRTCNWGKDAFHAGLWYQGSKQSVLNFRNLYGAPMSRLLRIVAHEARHAVQYRDGLLEEGSRSSKTTHNGKWEEGYWKGEYYSGPYKDAPWEKDARAYETKYSSMVIDSGIISNDELKMTLAGKQDQTITLERETRAEIWSKHGNVSYYKASLFTKDEMKQRHEQFKKLVQKAGFTYDKKEKLWNCDPKQDYKVQEKAWKQAKKQTRQEYCKNSIAFLTREEERKLSKDDRFWAAQKNRVFYKTRPLEDDDLVF
jgi:hypothetical protein